MTLWIHPNVGAEEPLGGDPPPAVACVARLFAGLFADGSRRTDRPDPPLLRARDLGFEVDRKAFRFLSSEEDDAVYAWLNDDEAARTAQEKGVPLRGADPAVVRSVHDKAFALSVSREQGYEARSLRGLVSAFDPEELEDADAVVRAIERRVGDWPAFTGGRYCLKPRIGGSGRGRVGARRGDDTTALRQALPRLVRQGGALLEPWLERECDLSAQLFVADDGTLTLLGSFEQRVSDSGVYRGHRARLDHRLRISSGHPDESAMLEAASAVALAAYGRGFRGPCGVDAFTFRGEHGIELRPVVELNARFTVGTIVAGLIRLAKRVIEAEVPAEPGETRHLAFDLRPPQPDAPNPPGVASTRVALGQDPGGFAPALVVRHAGPQAGSTAFR